MSAYDDAKAAILAALVSTRTTKLTAEQVRELITNLTDAAATTHSVAADPHPQYALRETLDALLAGANIDYDSLAEIGAGLAGKQPLDADLTAIAALTPSAGKLLVGTAAGWALLDATGIANDWAFVRDSAAASGFKFAAVSGGGGAPANVTYNTGGIIAQFAAATATDVPLVAKGAVGQTGSLVECRLSDNSVVFSVSPAGTGGFFGKVSFGNGAASIGENGSGWITVRSAGGVGWCSGSNGLGAPDTMLLRNAAGVVEINNGTAGQYRDLVARHLTLTGSLGSPDLRALQIAVAELKGDRISMPNGIVDPFADASDVATATNATLSGGRFAPTVTTAAVSGATGTNIGDMTNFGTLANIFDGTTSQVGTTGFGTTGSGSTVCGGKTNVVAGQSAYAGKTYGAGRKIASVTLYGPSDRSYFETSAAGEIRLYAKNGVPANATDGTLLATTGALTGLAANDVRTLTSSDAATAYTNVWVAFLPSGATGHVWCAEIVVNEATAVNNMTLISAAFTAASAPALTRIGIEIKPIDAITINTDLIAYASRDGGTTWTAATLAIELTRENGAAIYVHDGLSISGQPSGTSMKWKIVTANNKNVEIHGIDEFKWR